MTFEGRGFKSAWTKAETNRSLNRSPSSKVGRVQVASNSGAFKGALALSV